MSKASPIKTDIPARERLIFALDVPDLERARALVDILGDADAERYRAASEIVLADENVDGLLVLLTPQAMTDPTACAEGVVAAARKVNKPVLACWMGENLVKQGRKRFTEAGIPEFASPEGGVDAFGYLACYRRNQKALLQAPTPLSKHREPDVEGARLIIEHAMGERRLTLSNAEAKAILRAFHIPTSPSINVSSAADALIAAEGVGLPVAMKINSPDITHKSDVGGVRLNIREPRSVRTAFREMTEAVGAQYPDARIDVLGDPRNTVADATGFFRLALPGGNWNLEYSAFGYVTTTQNVTVIENGQEKHLYHSVRLYSFTEIEMLLGAAGLAVLLRLQGNDLAAIFFFVVALAGVITGDGIHDAAIVMLPIIIALILVVLGLVLINRPSQVPQKVWVTSCSGRGGRA